MFYPEELATIAAKFAGDAETLKHEALVLAEIKKPKSSRPKVFFFSGDEGFKKIWEKIFSSGIKEYCIITDPREMLGFVKKGYITEKIIKAKIKAGLKSRQIIGFSEYAKEIVAKDASENRISKILPHIYRIPVTKIIFGTSVAFIGPLSEDTMMIVESEAFAKTEQSAFEALWSFLPVRVEK